MKSISQLYREHRGKLSDKWTVYLHEYDRLFAPYRDKSLTLLEIGVQNGGSLEIWGKAFPNAIRLIGCDITPDCEKLIYDDERICLVICDATTEDCQRMILSEASDFDIIIDDASHSSGDIVRSFARYFSCLNGDGLYVIEDLHCSYWQQFDGGLYHPYSSMAFFKCLADIVHHEHWGIDKSRNDLIEGFEKRWNIRFEEQCLATIHSVEFINSLCAIKKGHPQENIVGPRVIAGLAENVVHGHHLLDGTQNVVPDQRGNEWSNRTTSVEEQSVRLAAVLAERDGQIASLTQAVAARDGQIAGLSQTVAERDGQLASLTQAVAERDGQLNAANEKARRTKQAYEEAESILQSERDKVIRLLSQSNDKVTVLENTLSRIQGWYGFRIISWVNRISLFRKVD